VNTKINKSVSKFSAQGVKFGGNVPNQYTTLGNIFGY